MKTMKQVWWCRAGCGPRNISLVQEGPGLAELLFPCKTGPLTLGELLPSYRVSVCFLSLVAPGLKCRTRIQGVFTSPGTLGIVWPVADACASWMPLPPLPASATFFTSCCSVCLALPYFCYPASPTPLWTLCQPLCLLLLGPFVEKSPVLKSLDF